MPQTVEKKKGNWATDPEAAAKAKVAQVIKEQREAKDRRESLTVGMKERNLGTVIYDGQEYSVLWRRGGKVYIELEDGIRKEVEE
jgi:hypothetical protein